MVVLEEDAGPAVWHVVIPLKDPGEGKSRLPAPMRRELARAFALDVVDAACRAARVAAVHVVTSRGFADDLLARPRPAGARPVLAIHGAPAGLNEAVRFGLAALREAGDPAVAVLLGDVPALRSADLDEALLRAASHVRSFVRDADGDGTTLVAARAGAGLDPAFGAGSAAAHAARGLAEIGGSLATLRRDVDTLAALRSAARLGLGEESRRVVERGEADRPPGRQ